VGLGNAGCSLTGVQKPLIATLTDPVGSGAFQMQPAETRMIFIVGANVRLMEWAALSLFRAGHIPVLGQWFWPLVASDMASDARYEAFGDPVGERLLGRCDAILRVDDPAPETDLLISIARTRGLRVYDSLDDAIAG
jgi:hypothetical protein